MSGTPVEENIISSAISRVLSAQKDWDKILACAENPELKIIISNTTEAGIELVEEDINQAPPKSFPAKLLAFLYHRYKTIADRQVSGTVIIPTELIPDNGKKLFEIVLELAVYNKLEPNFFTWLKTENHFCNSLVDRIVPGKPAPEILDAYERELGYKDDLLICAEPYKLWAIEAPEKVKETLSFYKAGEGVVIEENIDKYRELKLRLLNGTHSFCCGLAFFKGFKTVREAMEDKFFTGYIERLLFDEIAPAIPYAISEEEKRKFGHQVLDRFKNPAIDHQWLSISLIYTAKMKMRNKDLIINYYKLFNKVPQHFATGFASYLQFMKPVSVEGTNFYGEFNGNSYLINDTQAKYFYELWKNHSAEEAVQEVLKNRDLWDYDLDSLPEFREAIILSLSELQR
jgi:tagaturonate reductase